MTPIVTTENGKQRRLTNENDISKTWVNWKKKQVNKLIIFYYYREVNIKSYKLRWYINLINIIIK